MARMACRNGRTNNALWKKSKADAKRRACKRSAARCDTWDARMAQDAGRIYRNAGGEYCGPRTASQRSLTKWTGEKWTTSSGRPACERVTKTGRCADRYLPAEAWRRLSPAEKAATVRAKRAARGQFAPNSPAAKRASKQAR